MTTANFETTSIDWEIRQLQRRISEWLEWVFRQRDNAPTEPGWTIPEWLARGLFWFVVMALVLWLGWLLYQWLSPYLDSWTFTRSRSASTTPPQKVLTVAEWLARSQLAYKQRNYREACRALYMAALQRLNDSGLVLHQGSRTDGEYLNLVQTLPHANAYQTLIQTHERLQFADSAISQQECDRCQQAYRELDTP